MDLLEFCLGIVHNVDIMLTSDRSLVNWAHKKQRSSVTLGQLVSLLELTGHESVAAIDRKAASNAVNYRQKLDRLEKALAIGRLTKRVGNVTQPSELGQRIAGEIRLLLLELSRESGTGQGTVWVFGAGDSWLQNVVVPTLARWPKGDDAPRWEVANLKAKDLCTGLRAGRIHYGLLRVGDLKEERGLDRIRTYQGIGHTVLMSGAAKCDTLREAVAWAAKEKHPLVQQGSSWLAFRATLIGAVGEDIAAKITPTVICETHPQAAGGVANGRGWTIVPSIVARSFEKSSLSLWPVDQGKPSDEVALVVSGRVLEKLNGGFEAADALKRELGLTIAGLKK